MFPKKLGSPEMLCVTSSPMTEETGSGLKPFVRLITKCNCLFVPCTLLVLFLKPGLFVMFESSMFQGWSGCTFLEQLLVVVIR